MKKYLLLFLLMVVAIVVGQIVYKSADQALTKYAIQKRFEANAIGSLRTLNTALTTYSYRHGKVPPSLRELGPQGDDLVRLDLSRGMIPGYEIYYKPGNGLLYEIQAESTTEGRNFFTDQTGVIHVGLDASGPKRD